jgi:UPF0042 nucleotide-binding protein
MRVQVMSFGHKYGNPGDLELLFDVRHLPNPHFVPELKRLSGHDSRVVKYLRSHDEVKETLKRFTDLLSYLLPLYKREGKSYVTVGIGCTGGRHRSVMIANALARLCVAPALTRTLASRREKTKSLHRSCRKSA